MKQLKLAELQYVTFENYVYRISIIMILYFISFLSKAFVFAQPVTSPGNSNVFVIITRRCSRSKSQLYFVGFFIFSSFGSTSICNVCSAGTMSLRMHCPQCSKKWKNSAITPRDTLLNQKLKSILKKSSLVPIKWQLFWETISKNLEV